MLAIIAVLVIAVSISNMGEKIEWENMVLGEMLPEPPNNRGEIFSNDSEELRIDIESVTPKECEEYISSCKDTGFVIEAEKTSYDFSAYNTEGYKLTIDYLDSASEMGITLEKPMEMEILTWPNSVAGQKIPAPKSTIGKFSYEYEDNFLVYVGNTTKTDYAEYVAKCCERGFTVDYNKGDEYYYADDSDGWHISINYEGNNVIRINIDAPSEDDDDEIDTNSSIDQTISNSSTDLSNNNSTSEGIDPDFKEAMDEYEEFMNDYVEFMKKYNKNPGDLSLLSDYADFMSDYADYVEDFDAWEDEDLNSAELAYYLDVQTRVTKKLLEVAQ